MAVRTPKTIVTAAAAMMIQRLIGPVAALPTLSSVKSIQRGTKCSVFFGTGKKDSSIGMVCVMQKMLANAQKLP